jgi:predicted NUDIX family phosphoesterase
LARASRQTEQVWVVPRAEIFADGRWQGIRDRNLEETLARIGQGGRFMPRRAVEEDPDYQQIIPYIIFRHQDRYLLTKRLKASSERRLHHLYSLGVGGHINPPDNVNADPIADGLQREWLEEVQYLGAIERRLIGVIKDDSTAVGQVHLGLVYLLEGEHPSIQIRETGKMTGALLTLEEMRIYYLDMESWSQLIYDYLLLNQ